jgi:hypothetical protein
MKKTKFILTIIILLMTFSVSGCFQDQAPPTITRGEFPFRVVYEMDGEIFTIEDTVIVSYGGLHYPSKNSFNRQRSWISSFRRGNDWYVILENENSPSALTSGRINISGRLSLRTGFGAYYMGENVRGITYRPHFIYEETYQGSHRVEYKFSTLNERQVSERFGIEILVWEFSRPIRNRFVR